MQSNNSGPPVRQIAEELDQTAADQAGSIYRITLPIDDLFGEKALFSASSPKRRLFGGSAVTLSHRVRTQLRHGAVPSASRFDLPSRHSRFSSGSRSPFELPLYALPAALKSLSMPHPWDIAKHAEQTYPVSSGIETKSGPTLRHNVAGFVRIVAPF
jgi:hypothetical protein